MSEAQAHKKQGAATFAPWAECDIPAVTAAVGVPSQTTILRHMPLSDLIRLAAEHIEDMRGDEVLVRVLEERAVEVAR